LYEVWRRLRAYLLCHAGTVSRPGRTGSPSLSRSGSLGDGVLTGGMLRLFGSGNGSTLTRRLFGPSGVIYSSSSRSISCSIFHAATPYTSPNCLNLSTVGIVCPDSSLDSCDLSIPVRLETSASESPASCLSLRSVVVRVVVSIAVDYTATEMKC
jgi:hypothetical protein